MHFYLLVTHVSEYILHKRFKDYRQNQAVKKKCYNQVFKQNINSITRFLLYFHKTLISFQ